MEELCSEVEKRAELVKEQQVGAAWQAVAGWLAGWLCVRDSGLMGAGSDVPWEGRRNLMPLSVVLVLGQLQLWWLIRAYASLPCPESCCCPHAAPPHPLQAEYERIKVAYATLSSSVESLSSEKRQLEAQLARLEAEGRRTERERRCEKRWARCAPGPPEVLGCWLPNHHLLSWRRPPSSSTPNARSASQ